MDITFTTCVGDSTYGVHDTLEAAIDHYQALSARFRYPELWAHGTDCNGYFVSVLCCPEDNLEKIEHRLLAGLTDKYGPESN